ncbi:hypothetical protein PoB_005234600 [Plakobranchus ocellatus]|uniref:Uncharacterized protein n=1 Tax=Plakobranchus ocellatus TaxID=259542 RepID=A0AAV4BRG7_9GAST|nr:hypothetical protein PoB_005234600 [Plakobranchus ocellatus]
MPILWKRRSGSGGVGVGSPKGNVGGDTIATDVRPGCKTQRIAPALRKVASRLGVRSHQRNRVFQNMYCWTRELLPPVWAYAYCALPNYKLA